jgi:hypothetical protein
MAEQRAQVFIDGVRASHQVLVAPEFPHAMD